jgi:cell division transport system permease protein
MFDRISFVVGEAMIALRRHSFMAFSAVTTVAIALYLLGGLGFAYIKAISFAHSIPGKFEMRVNLRDGINYRDIKETAASIRALPGVATVTWIPRGPAWQAYRMQYPERTEGIDNPFMDAFKVTLNDLAKADAVAGQIRSMPAVRPTDDGVRYMKKEQELVQGWIDLLAWLSWVGVLLLFISGILIFNTIRLAIISRAIEIRIMSLVGASRLTMAVPFLIEGFVQGLLGGVLAGLLVWASYHFIGSYLHQSWGTVWPDFPAAPTVAFLATVGAAFGAACSLLALRVRQAR